MNNIFNNNYDELSIINTLINLILCATTSFIIRYFYLSFSKAASNRGQIADVLPLLSCIIFIVILIVKNSLALSLGLVGALSIVRFRTPIKEPEELVYLFFAIAIGLAYGSGQTLITLITSFFIFVLIYMRAFFFKEYDQIEFNVVIEWKNDPDMIEEITENLQKISPYATLIRYENNLNLHNALFTLTPNKLSDLLALIKSLKSKKNIINFTYSKANQIF